MEKELPLRETVRVLITKNGRICLGRVWNEHGRLAYYTFPGGGVEPGATHVQTLQQECLEEVGIRIRNIEKLPLIVNAEHPMSTSARSKIWRGSSTHHFRAEWDRYDNTLRNAVGDAMHYTWELPRNAIRMIESAPPDPFNKYRVEAIRMIMANTLPAIAARAKAA